MALRPATNVTVIGPLLALVLFLHSTLGVISGETMDFCTQVKGELELSEQKRHEPENERKGL